MKAHAVVSLLLAALLAPAIAAIPKTDHPLISAYEGSEMRRKDVKAFNEYAAFMGMDESGKQPKVMELRGKVTKILYTKPKDRSILEVFKNYEDAVTRAGAEILFRCNQEKRECAAAYAGPTLQKASGIHSVSNLVGRYFLAKLQQDEQTAYIAIAVGQSFADVHVVEVKAMEMGKVVIDAAALGRGLDAQGFVVVEGIYFDTDKATLKSQSGAALTQMAALLAERPGLAVHVVGHTDSQGSFEHNQSLSAQRAQAVVEALTAQHGVSKSRLRAHGVGPLAPQASNESEGGRARNRRVVLVVQGR